MFFRRNLPKKIFYVLATVLLLLLGNFLGIFRPIRGLVEKKLVVPTYQQVYDWQRTFRRKEVSCQLESEKEIAELKASVSSLTEENKEQKRLLSVPIPKNWQFLTVKIVSLGNEILTLNVGRKESVKEGMVAIWGNTYLGKVSLVSEEFSQVKLPSFYEEKSAVTVFSPSGEVSGKGLLVGKGTGKMRVEQILTDENVQKGDLVVTNVEGGDLLLGEVEEVIKSEGGAFKAAQIKRLYEPEELNTIFLIRGRL